MEPTEEAFKRAEKLQEETQKKYLLEGIRNYLAETSGKQPIYRGCPNRECFCTGRCKEIVGWEDKPKTTYHGFAENITTVRY